MRYVCIRREEDMVSCPKEANLVTDCKECAYYAPFRWYDYVFITIRWYDYVFITILCLIMGAVAFCPIYVIIKLIM